MALWQWFLDEEVLPMIDVDMATEDGQVLILMLRFLRDAFTVIYYLVYDAKDASLYMILTFWVASGPLSR